MWHRNNIAVTTAMTKSMELPMERNGYTLQSSGVIAYDGPWEEECWIWNGLKAVWLDEEIRKKRVYGFHIDLISMEITMEHKKDFVTVKTYSSKEKCENDNKIICEDFK